MKEGETFWRSQVVFVTWVDSYTDGGWDSLKEKLDDDHFTGQCKSVGWVVEDTEDWLGLVNSWSGDHSVNSLLRIPKVAIKEIRAIADLEKEMEKEWQ